MRQRRCRYPQRDEGPRKAHETAAAKAEVAALIDRMVFAGIDLGSLAVGGELAQFPGGPLPNQNLIKMD
jgi:8-hydroxy-5-deazaflavin:NADPH oxidoreductase